MTQAAVLLSSTLPPLLALTLFQVAALQEHVRRARCTLRAYFTTKIRSYSFCSEKETRANSELAHVRADKQRLEALLQVCPPPLPPVFVSTSQEPIFNIRTAFLFHLRSRRVTRAAGRQQQAEGGPYRRRGCLA